MPDVTCFDDTIRIGGPTVKIILHFPKERRPQPDKPEHLSAYFYVQDAKGKSKLAVIGTNTGSYHFVYVSQDLGKGIPSLRCTNRSKVVEWLNSIGATEQIDESGETVPDGCRPLEKKAKIEKTSKIDARKGTGERAGKAEEVAKRGGGQTCHQKRRGEEKGVGHPVTETTLV
ncbi:hypothetical protein BSKO_09494 [Bryopsis sp. KO-2023]|nr:hypothetical protein BSKO_09494 [Bryopsis sp. KO-2023]